MMFLKDSFFCNERNSYPVKSASELKEIHKKLDQFFPQERLLEPQAIVYLIYIISGSEKFYKIGHTKNSLMERFKNTDIPTFTTKLIVELPLSEARLLEKTLHDAFNNKRHIPTDRFSGWTECFCLNQEDISLIKELFNRARTCPLL